MVKISRGNMKTGKVDAISLTPILSCGNCGGCRRDCYALKAYRMYASVRAAWDHNYFRFLTDPKGYFSDINKALRRKRNRLFRWHVSGDIVNERYLIGIREIALAHPNRPFLCFTKMYMYDYSNLPDNLSIVLSAWPQRPIENHDNLPIAWMQDGTEDRIPDDAKKCLGNCETCGICWMLTKTGYDIVFNKH